MDGDVATVAEAWQFMLPWCENLRDRVGYAFGESTDPPDQFARGLKIYSPRQPSIRLRQSDEEAEREYLAQRQKLRETLALLSVVARVDNDAWRRLLVRAKVLNYQFSVPEEFDGEFPARFVVELPFGRRISDDDYDNFSRGIFVLGTDANSALKGDLAQFCGVEQHAKYSKEYDATMKNIVEIWREKQPDIGDVPDEVEVPITVNVGPYSMRSPGAVVKYFQNVIGAIRHIRESSWKRPTGRKGYPRVTFVVEGVLADLRPVQIRSELAALVENLAREGIRCSGLGFRQQLGNALAAPAKRGGARKAVGKLLTNLFGGAPRKPSVEHNGQSGNMAKLVTGPRVSKTDVLDQIQLDSVNFHCEPSRCWFFERMCSAASVNQTASKLSIVMQENGDAELFRWRWQWVCYGFFSKRARRYSRLQNLTLRDVRIIAEDVEAMRAVMSSDRPEEDLLGLAPQLQQNSGVFIKVKASIRLQPMDANEALGNNANFTVRKEIRGAKLLSSSAENGWVDVLVPGFGRCQTRQASLVPDDKALSLDAATGLSSLVVMFLEDPEEDVLCHFLELIGNSLKYLTLQLNRFDTNYLKRIVASCPCLVEVAICMPALEARFRARDIKHQNQSVALPAETPVSFEDVTATVRLLCATGNPFANSVRRLRVRMRRDFEQRITIPPMEELCVTLLLMLRLNRSLEYLDIVSTELNLAFMMLFKGQHLEKLAVIGAELPIKSKLAFLSVMGSNRQEHASSKLKRARRSPSMGVRLRDLDRHVIRLIFAFAATPAVRNVYFRLQSDVESRCDYIPV